MDGINIVILPHFTVNHKSGEMCGSHPCSWFTGWYTEPKYDTIRYDNRV